MKAVLYFSFSFLFHCMPISKDQDPRIYAQTTLDIVTYGGATPNDLNDDRVAIRKTIDAVHAAGGGIVTIPAGTFLLSTVPDTSPIQVMP